ncbi:MAG: NAD-dependent epimerase/dehydratase family protein [Alphaproteobacteria bacterium]|nr:MAG: NAD-dependent epimerase/dehydratase family protein [Alphaproteobacteria bacterium]
MQVLILGGTGSIGAPVVRALVGRGHHVIALARSNSSATKAASLGANPLGGDIAAVERWLPALPPLDAVVHLACDFGSDMVDVDRRLLDGLLPHLAAQPNQATFIYTGGCWLFGATGDDVANEQAPFHPLPAFICSASLKVKASRRSSFIRPWCTRREPACSLSSSPRLASGGQSAWSVASTCAGRWSIARILPISTCSRSNGELRERVTSARRFRVCRSAASRGRSRSDLVCAITHRKLFPPMQLPPNSVTGLVAARWTSN